MLEWLFKKVTAAQVRDDDLREAEVGLLVASRHREYWEHQESMYLARISRLRTNSALIGTVSGTTFPKGA